MNDWKGYRWSKQTTSNVNQQLGILKLLHHRVMIVAELCGTDDDDDDDDV